MAYAPERVLRPILQEQPRQVERPWLAALKEFIIRASEEAAAEYWPPRRDDDVPYYNYRLEHLQQVERDAMRIYAIERGDLDVLLAAIWAHDRYQPQFSGDRHAERAAQWAKDYLKFIRFPDSKINDVCKAILYHNHSELDIPESLHEARLLWDADHVTRLGPADILSFMLCHTSEDFLNNLDCNDRFPKGMITMRDFVPLLIERRPQFYRADFFYFDETRRMAKERITAARGFLDCLQGQMNQRPRMPAR